MVNVELTVLVPSACTLTDVDDPHTRHEFELSEVSIPGGKVKPVVVVSTPEIEIIFDCVTPDGYDIDTVVAFELGVVPVTEKILMPVELPKYVNEFETTKFPVSVPPAVVNTPTPPCCNVVALITDAVTVPVKVGLALNTTFPLPVDVVVPVPPRVIGRVPVVMQDASIATLAFAGALTFDKEPVFVMRGMLLVQMLLAEIPPEPSTCMPVLLIDMTRPPALL